MSDTPERICPDCGSRHYARCDERHEDGKWHPGSILRCIECKATFLDPALAASPEVAALIREAKARGMERAAEICEGIRTRIANGPMPEGARFDYEQAIRAAAAAHRKDEETPT